MKKINLILITILSITQTFATEQINDISADYIRAAFWTFTLVISVGGMLFILKSRQEQE